ncbi:MAG: helix-turn-helix domain-containing protein [Thermoleophilaceae bacterium]
MPGALLPTRCENKLARVDLPTSGSDDPLAQSTRRRLFALLTELGSAVTTDELAERLALHPNGVRTHLRRLLEAGLVVRRRVGGPIGRPRDEWAISPLARPGGDPPQAYATLARWLARSIPASPARLREVEATGRDVGRELAAGGGPADHVLGDVLSALGCQPAVELRDGRFSCRLGNCPFRDSVRENQDVVCTLHRGLTRGLLDRVAPAATLARFVPHDPDLAGCEIEIEGLTV